MATAQRSFELLHAGDIDGLHQLLEQNPSACEDRDSTGVSLLMHSLYRGRRDLAELIAGKKQSLDQFEAASLGRLDRLEECLHQEGRDPATTESRSDTPSSGNAHSIDAHSIDAHSNDGFTALHFACYFGQPASARLLIESGAAVDAVAANPTQVMPLHSAASARNLEAVRLLLEYQAPVNARQQAGWTPIHAAAQNGDRPMVDLLLQHGADPKLANTDGKTPAAVAREKGHDAIAALLEK